MPPIRFRSRHLHATIYNLLHQRLDQLGWITGPINFGARPITMIDYMPDDRNAPVKHNTIAVSLGDFDVDEDEELGAAEHGLRRAPYTVFIDVYMEEQALAIAVCDDIRDIFTDESFHLVDQITGSETAHLVQVTVVNGPNRNQGAQADVFRRYWRTMQLEMDLYFLS